ncbi:MAG: MFS transporter [Lachnospiraceae bacterium]
MMISIKNQNGWQTSRIERISYGLYFAGQNLFYMIVSTFTALFLINKGLSEVTVASVLLIPKIWDAVNDPVFGIIMDKAKFRKGRFLPWLKISWILIPASTVFLFAMPETLPQSAKIAWAVIGYIFWDTSYTMCDAPIFALSTSMSAIVEERTYILSFGRLFATAGSILATLGIEALYLSAGWTILAVCLAILAMLLMFPVLLFCKERSHAHNENDPTLHEMFRALRKNKYLLVFFISYFFIASTMSVEILIPIFAHYVLGSTAVGTILLGICTVPMIAIAALIPTLSKKTDKFLLYIFSIALFIAASILQYVTGYQNPILLYGTMFIRAIGFGGYNILLFLFVPDLVEYGHYTTGERQEGICFSLQTFMTKLTAAIVSSLSLIILGLFGFASANADPVTGVVDAAAGKGFWTVFTLAPAVGSILALPILIQFYRLRDKDVQLMSLCNNGELPREDCERQLSHHS